MGAPRDDPDAEAAAQFGARRCDVCGGAPVFAVAPGAENTRVADLFAVSRGEPLRAWCAACWPWRPQEEQSAPPRMVSPD